MTNSFIISFGDFKIDLPVDALASLAKQAASKQAVQKKPAAPAIPKVIVNAISKEFQTPEVIKQAAPVVQAPAPTPKKRGPRIPYGRYSSFNAFLKDEVLPKLPTGSSQFVSHPNPHLAVNRALDVSYQLRAKGNHIVISVKQAIESGVSGIRIFRLR